MCRNSMLSHRMWLGDAVDFAHSKGDYALFTMVAAGAAAIVDAEVFRAFVRRIGLDSTEVLDADHDIQRRIEDVFQEILASPRPAPGPTRDELVAVTSAAATSSA